jgi:hypothetical protein
LSNEILDIRVAEAFQTFAKAAEDVALTGVLFPRSFS